MAPGGKMFRFTPHCGENVLRHGSHEWLPYSKNAVCTKPSNTNIGYRLRTASMETPHVTTVGAAISRPKGLNH